MGTLAVVFLLLLATVALTPVANRVHLPLPVLVTVFGLALSFAPGVTEIRLEPALILPLVLPPLIYAAARRTTWRQFTANARPILLLAVALVFVSTAAVAATAWVIVPGITGLAAIVLGAIVSPPDAVAAIAVAGPLGMPRRLVTLLEGEGLCNDVTALTIYQVALIGVTTGSFSVTRALTTFVVAAVGAVVIGLVLGRLTLLLAATIDTPNANSALTLLVPFAAYVLADRLHCSGVLAVLVIALYLGHFGVDAMDVERRLTGAAFWDVVELLLTGFGFGLVGVELRRAFDTVIRNNGLPGPELLWHAAVICAVIIGVRALWLLPAAWAAHLAQRAEETETPTSWRETVVMIWSGMRGVVTVATALALPTALNDGRAYPAREETITIALAVVLVTLVAQGLTLPTVVRGLRVSAPEDLRDAAEAALIVRAGRAGLAELKRVADLRELPEGVVDVLRSRLRAMIAAANPDAIVDPGAREALIERAEQRRLQREIEAELLAAARREVLAARTEPGMDPEVVDDVLRRFDLRTIHLM